MGNYLCLADSTIALIADVVNRCSEDSIVVITLPHWVHESDYFSTAYYTDEDRMGLAIELSKRNIALKTGGPFGCAIFEKRTHTNTGEISYHLLSVGVNQVTTLKNSTLHGEVVAIQMAQKKLGLHTLGKSESANNEVGYLSEYELYTSCEPCCMCLGATLWSGVSRLVCGAKKDDADAAGFDEGPVFESSYEHLQKVGICVTRDLLREKAAVVLKEYGKTGMIY